MSERSVIITGSANGIGAACAIRFAKAGDRLILVDTDEVAGRAIEEQLKTSDAKVSFVAADIASRLHVHNVIAEVLENYGQVDVLVNASTQYLSSSFLDTSEEDFNALLQHNLTGTFLLNQAVAKQFIRQREKQGEDINASPAQQAIVNFGSVDGVVTQAEHVAFAATQGGLQQLTKAIALSLSPYNVNVNTVGTGPTRGEQEGARDDKNLPPLKRWGEPEDAANLAYFLSTKEAAYITGQTIYVDGGQLICNHTNSETDLSLDKS